MIYQAAHSVAYVPPVDAVEEFKVVTGAYDAQYGRNGGGVMTVALKSGTNIFHGTAYEFMKRSFLDANTFANNAVGRRAELRQARRVGRYAGRSGVDSEGLQGQGQDVLLRGVREVSLEHAGAEPDLVGPHGGAAQRRLLADLQQPRVSSIRSTIRPPAAA